MQLSLSTFVYLRYSLVEAVRRTASHGYGAVEIWGGRPHAYADDMDGARIAAIRDVIADCGLSISNFIPAQFRYPVNIATAEEPLRRASVDYLRRSIDAAAALGAPLVSICPGFSVWPQTPAEAWERMLLSLTELVAHVRGLPLVLVLEPAHRMETDLVVTVDDGLRVVHALDGALGLLPDTGHLYLNRESLSDAVAKVQGLVCHWHIDDNLGTGDDHLVPGEGRIPFEYFLQRLMASCYAGALAVELGYQYTADPDAAARKSIAFLRAKLSEVA